MASNQEWRFDTRSSYLWKSKIKVWWKCDKGPDHQWEALVYSRTKKNGTGGTGCPFCSNKEVSTTNSLAHTHPKVAAEWHPDRNGTFNPENFVFGSTKKVWWKCDKGDDHEWQTSINRRTNPKTGGTGCPFCSNKEVSTTNSLAHTHPEVAAEWHPDRNGQLTPDMVTRGSNKKVWWKCSKVKSHQWKALPNDRTNSRTGGSGCPFCSGNNVSEANNLASKYPDVAEQWHPTKNGDLLPNQVSYASGKRVWWKCDAGPDHEWITTVASRTKEKSGCPSCSGYQVSQQNRLSILHPDIAEQWHKTKNGLLTPKSLSWGSKQKVWWECSLNHEWKTTVRARTRLKTCCPICDLTPRSKMEIYLAHEMSYFFEIDVDDCYVHSLSETRPLLVDIKIPNQKLIIEYDGAYWHKGKQRKLRDLEKTKQLTQIGWIVIRIRLDEQEKIWDDDILMEAEDHKDAKSVANNLILKLVELGYLQQSDYDSYQARDSLINEDKAEAYIQQLLNAKVDQNSQLNLFDE